MNPCEFRHSLTDSNSNRPKQSKHGNSLVWSLLHFWNRPSSSSKFLSWLHCLICPVRICQLILAWNFPFPSLKNQSCWDTCNYFCPIQIWPLLSSILLNKGSLYLNTSIWVCSVPNLRSRKTHTAVHESLHSGIPKMMRLNNSHGINLKLDTTTSTLREHCKRGSEEMSELEIWRRDAKYHPLDTTQPLPPWT